MATRNTARFDIRADDKTRKAFNAVDRRMEKMRGSAIALSRTMVSLAGFAGFGAAIKSNIDYADSLAKTSKKIGVTTEALAGLQLAAQLTGVETHTLDTGLRNMVRNIADLARGTGEAQIAFERLGLTAQQLVGLSPDQQFVAIAEALNKVENNTLKVDAAYKIFGGRATALLNTLALGEKGLADVAARARELGIALSSEDAKRFEDLADSMLLFKEASRGASLTLTKELAPALTDIANAFADSDGIIPAVGRALNTFVDFGQFIGGFGASLVQFAEGNFTRAANIMNQALADLIHPPEPITIGIEKPAGDNVLPPVDPAAMQARLASIELQLGTEEERIIASAEKRARIVEDAEQQTIITHQRATELLAKIDAKAGADIVKARAKTLTALQKFTQASFKAQAATVVGELTNMTQSVATQNRAMFEINKVAQIAQAIINAHGSASRTMAAYPFPINVGLAGLSLAAGFAQVQAIRSASFGGGGGMGASIGGGGAVPTFNANPVTSLPEAQATQPLQATTKTDVVINIGDQSLFTDRAVRELIDKIDEQIRDGVVIGSLSVG